MSKVSNESDVVFITRWPIERATNLLGGSLVLISVLMGTYYSDWWLLLTAFVGANLLMNAAVGWCPASLIMRRLGIPSAAQCTRQPR